ncbi:MAG: protein kinase [Pirellulales bacterium]
MSLPNKPPGDEGSGPSPSTAASSPQAVSPARADAGPGEASPPLQAALQDTLEFSHDVPPPVPAEREVGNRAAVEFPLVPGYEILRQLGQGGMGRVYLARDPRLKRHVALKMLQQVDVNGEDLARFRLEAQAVARLQHPHLVQVFEVGEVAGRPYCVLEYAPGGSLAQKLAGTARPPREAAQWMEKVARGVQCAHEAGIVHRDLKPANVLLDSHDEPKVADFGLAKRIDDQSGLTRTGMVLGTPSYMAPEQAEGRGDEVGPPADVYALGAILYELLTGRPPFQGATVLDTLRQVREQEPIPPSRLQSGLPRDLETICLKCLEKSPHRRYDSALALATDLQHWLLGRPITARPVGQLERGIKWARREPRLAGLGALLATVLVSAFGIVSWQLHEARQSAQELRKALGDRTDALRAESTARQGEQTALRKERTAREEAQYQTQLKELELLRASRALYGSRVARAWRELELGDVVRADQLLLDCEPAQRRWEWHLLHRVAQRRLLRFSDHADAHCIRVSASGERIMTFRDPVVPVYEVEPAVQVWETRSGRQSLVVPGFAGAFSPSGQQVAILVADGPTRAVVKLFDTAQGRLLREYPGSLQTGVAIAFADQGRSLVAVDRAETVVCWDVETAQERYRKNEPQQPLPQGMISLWRRGLCTFSGDGNMVALASGLLLETRAGQIRAQLGKHYSATFSSDGTRVACVTLQPQPTVRVFDTVRGEEILSCAVPPGSNGGTSVAALLRFHPDGTRLACGNGAANLLSGQRAVIVEWSLPDGRENWRAVTEANAVSALAYAPDGRSLAAGRDDGTIELRDASSGQTVLVLRSSVGRVITDLAFVPGNRELLGVSAGSYGVTLKADSEIERWDVAPRSLSSFFQLTTPTAPADERMFANRPADRLYATRISADSAQVTWNGLDETGFARVPGMVALPPPARDAGSAAPTSPTEPMPISQPATRAGRRFALFDRKRDERQNNLPGRLVVVDASGSEQRLLQEGELNVQYAAQDRSQQRLVTLLGTSLSWKTEPPRGLIVKLWDRDTAREIWSLDRGTARGRAVALSPDGDCVAWVEQRDNNEYWMVVCAVPEQVPFAEFQTDAMTTGLAISADRRLLASAGHQGTLQLRALAGNAPPLSLDGHRGRIHEMMFTPDQARLVTGGADLVIRVWDVHTGQQLVELPGPGNAIESLDLSPDGHWLAAGDGRGALRIWNATPLAEPAFASWPPPREQLEQEIAAGRSDVIVWRQRADWQERERDWSGSAESWLRVAELESTVPLHWQRVLKAARQAERWDLLVEANTRLIGLNHELPVRWLGRGEAQARQRKFTEAAADYARGEQLVGNNLELKCTAAGLLLLAGRTDDYQLLRSAAIQQARQSGWLEARHGNAPRNAYLLARLACFAPAVPAELADVSTWARQAVAAQRSSWNLHVLGLAELYAGRTDEALAAFADSKQADPDWCPELNELASALALHRRGEVTTAQRQISQTLASPPVQGVASASAWHLHDWIGLLLLARQAEPLLNTVGSTGAGSSAYERGVLMLARLTESMSDRSP